MDKLPDWSVFQERETLSLPGELLSPASEIAMALRLTRAQLAETRQTLQRSEQDNFSELAQQAVLIVQLGRLLESSSAAFLTFTENKVKNPLYPIYKQLQVIQKQMLDTLKKAGVEIEIPLHKTYAEVADYVEIEHWRHQEDITEEMVIDVIEPVIRKGALLRAGRVIMGAPLSQQSYTASEEQPASGQASQGERKDNRNHAQADHQ
ncbi:hypothetical protein [Dictyobacter aurantiacus]|uniref:Nucleotide exchange factor GrpE n=1 Tax=Dictyobacter aurantiacus TaxID=1936993 RepID=A0A401ZL13_9CHLR|nr:hypothetical protein [Dictyobacter aurantiacus]GCE07571.1 hypothetical protein KDAU_49000 [Dictyobacter aurantiacus]